MYLRERCIPSIKHNLAAIQQSIKAGNPIGFMDANSHAEDFFKVLLNKVYDLSLINLNKHGKNVVAIDLADETKGIAYQITSNNSIKKIKDTVEKFSKNRLNKRYNRLRILVIGEFKKRNELIKIDDFQFDLFQDVLTISDLIKDISSMSDPFEIESLDNWINSELNIRSSISKHPTHKDFDDFFERFLIDERDQVRLLLLAQPTLSDCREVFSDEYFIQVYNYYSLQYQYLVESDDDIKLHSLREKTNFKISTSTYSEIKSGQHNLPGGITSIHKKKALRPGKLQYHTVRFVEGDNEFGISYIIWVFINGRWVFFPKPWGIIDSIIELKNDSNVNRIIKGLSFLGLNKSFSKHHPIVLLSHIFHEISRKR